MKKPELFDEYGNNSIVQLKGEDRVRSKPSVIFGSDDIVGCEQSFFEILANSVDEAREGYGKEIITTYYLDKSIEVEDNGRGVPLGYNEKEKKYNWELIYCELYAGGKYNNKDEGTSYSYTLGTNGLGACATQYASEYMKVMSYDGNQVSEINFKKGRVQGKLKVSEIPKGSKKKRGTIVKWRPDLKVFKEIDIPKEYFNETMKRQAVVNAGIKFILRLETDKGFDTTEYYYKEGIKDRLVELSAGNMLIEPYSAQTKATGRDREDLPEYTFKVETIFSFTKSDPALEYYHNSSWLVYGGSPDKAVRAAFVYEFDKYLKNNNKYKKNEAKISFSDIQDCLLLITNGFSTDASYENQTKKAITNKFIEKVMTDLFKNSLEVFFAENPIDAEKAADQILINRRSREEADAARLDIKKKLSSSNDIANKVEKFVGCRSKDPEKRELYIVEGDSALTSCKLARRAEFQAIIPVRGKTLNCLKAPYAQIMKSDIITDLLKVIGCGVEIKSGGKEDQNFDPKNLKWSKIIICTDADEDGFQIRTLLLTLFYRLLPSLLRLGKVYIAESPLYEITAKETYFAYNEDEKTEILAALDEKKQKYTIMRSKGLGENEPEMMSKTTMDPASRRLIRVCESDAKKTAEIFELLLGNNLAERKEFIAEFGAAYAAGVDTAYAGE